MSGRFWSLSSCSLQLGYLLGDRWRKRGGEDRKFSEKKPEGQGTPPGLMLTGVGFIQVCLSICLSISESTSAVTGRI